MFAFSRKKLADFTQKLKDRLMPGWGDVDRDEITKTGTELPAAFSTMDKKLLRWRRTAFARK